MVNRAAGFSFNQGKHARMNIYLMRATNAGTGDNMDLYVRAETEQEALREALIYYTDGEFLDEVALAYTDENGEPVTFTWESPEAEEAIDEFLANVSFEWLGEAPGKPPGAIDWDIVHEITAKGVLAL